MKCRGAIFDMDGLLFDTEKVYQETWKELAEEYDVILTDTFAREISGTSGVLTRRILEKHYQVPDGSVLVNECIKRVRQKLEVYVPKKTGVDEILQYFHENDFKIAVASSSDKVQIESNLYNAGIRKWFDVVVSGTEVEHGKPAPDIFLLAAEKIGCNPEECYVFEDSENGVRAGYAAGCKTVMVPDLFKPSEEMHQISTMILGSLLEMIP